MEWMWTQKTYILVILSALLLFLVRSYSKCGNENYEADGKCCPMCRAGYHVLRHCDEHIITSCGPCNGSTFTDQPNGLTNCMPCSVCDHALGLKTVKECTPTSDTVCGALEGNYCVDRYEEGCRAAQKHTVCSPGQFIRQPGTQSTDAVCGECGDDSYSDGSSLFCKPHTHCQSEGLVKISAGDRTSDSKCVETSVVIGITLPLVIFIGFICLYCVCMFIRHRRQKSLIQRAVPSEDLNDEREKKPKQETIL